MLSLGYSSENVNTEINISFGAQCMTDYDYDEKRDFLRMNIETQITFTIKGSDSQSHHGLCDNLSATGLSMITSYALEEGCKIELIMNPNGDRLPPFVAEGTVLRVEAKGSDKFHASISMTKTS
jgi:hypothetical protein